MAAADEPQESLGGRTPLQAAEYAGDGCDRARRGRRPGQSCAAVAAAGIGCRLSQPAGLRSAAMFTGRAPLEAAAQGIALGPNDWAVRCNLVTIEDQVMREFTAGHISTDEARRLLAAAQERLGSDEMQFYPASAIAI